MEEQYRPFIVQVIDQESPSIVWATDESHARRLFQRQVAVKHKDFSVVDPTSIIIPDQMLKMPAPKISHGRITEVENGYKFIVPEFLATCSRAIIYTRVSTPQQKENSSFARQQATCEAFAKAAGLSILCTYQEVASGALYKARVKLQAALYDIESGLADVLLIESYDRLCRGTTISNDIQMRLQPIRAHIIPVMEQIPDSIDHKLMTDITDVFHTYKLDLAHRWGLKN